MLNSVSSLRLFSIINLIPANFKDFSVFKKYFLQSDTVFFTRGILKSKISSMSCHISSPEEKFCTTSLYALPRNSLSKMVWNSQTQRFLVVLILFHAGPPSTKFLLLLWEDLHQLISLHSLECFPGSPFPDTGFLPLTWPCQTDIC